MLAPTPHPVCATLPLPPLQGVLLPGARGWSELKAAAKKILQNLGEVQDTDRPLLTYTPQQLGALLQQQGIEVSAQAGPPWESSLIPRPFLPASLQAGGLAHWPQMQPQQQSAPTPEGA